MKYYEKNLLTVQIYFSVQKIFSFIFSDKNIFVEEKYRDKRLKTDIQSKYDYIFIMFYS